MQERNIIVCSLFLLFLIETTLFHWMIPSSWQANIHLTPHFVFVCLVMLALYQYRVFAVLLGLGFGLLLDIVFFGYMVGPHTFAMGLLVYLTGLLFGRMKLIFVHIILVSLLAILAYDMILYALYSLFRLTPLLFGSVVLHQVLPTLLFNGLFAVAIYIPLRFVVERMTSAQHDKES